MGSPCSLFPVPSFLEMSNAVSIARADGSVLRILSSQSRPPWAGGLNQNNGFDFDDD